MKAILTSVLAIGLLGGCIAEPIHAATARQPNMVLLFIDNVGYGDLGCYGNHDVKTPHIDRLAAQGVRCTEFYVASPTCSCSRGAILTGRHPERTGLVRQMPSVEQPGDGLNPSERLLPDYLRPLGYATGCFGKWNIGFGPGLRPTERGFDEFFGHRSGNMDYYTHIYNGQNDLYRGTEPATVEGYATHLIADWTCDFVRRNAGRPFFAYVPFNAAHYTNPRNQPPNTPVEWQVPAEYLASYGCPANEPDQKKRYRAVLTALDAGIGRILKQLDDLGLTDNTLVWLISDNGAFMLPSRGLEVASNLPLRDGGVTLWEGGVRVPAIVRWPGHIPPGTICREPVSQLDVLPMAVLAAGGAFTPSPGTPGEGRGEGPTVRIIDGRDCTATLAGQSPSPHQQLFWQWSKMSAVREGRYKLVRVAPDQPFQLFDLEIDLAETKDLLTQKPHIAARMQRDWERWFEQMRRDE